MKKGLKTVIILIVVLGVLGVLGRIAYFRYKDKLDILQGRGAETLDISTPVAVTKAKRGAISESLIFNGEIIPVTEVNIFTTVPGKVKEILVKEGDRVKKGDILVYIDRSEAGLTFAPTPVESTIDGVVKSVMAEIGAYSTPQMPLFQIIDMDTVEFVVRIPEKYIYKIKRGLSGEISVVAYPDRKFYGKVTKLSPVVDAMSRTQEVRLRIDNPRHTLKPGMFGDVKLLIRTMKDMVIIPLQAVIDRGGRDVIFVVNDGKALEIEPVLGIREGDKIAIEEGLTEGATVIVIGQQNVNTDDKVNITEEIE
ncbi:MAG: efflux RND transporter periplasmic adaptor subunit [Spirochaetota bacterium]|nr:MAG: efflux RND transporter periplasmic adaptor subunit [Spirochaetota bacterium]